MKTEGLLRRSIVLLTGLFILTLGIALSVKANLGISPVSSNPYVYSLGFPLTMGMFTVILNIIFILLQMTLLRRDYQWIQLLQLPVAMVFGAFTDLALYLVSSNMHVSNYLLQWLFCILSIALVALGVYLQVKAKVIYLAGEGLCLAISKTFHVEFGKVKVGLDCTLVVIGVISSFIFLHELRGIREGTIAAALLVGTTVRLYSRKLKFLDPLLGEKVPEVTVTRISSADLKKNLIITIAREFGSGGHEIGQIVARALDIPFYDKELIDLSAKEGRLSPEYVKAHEQKLKHSLLFELIEQNYAYVEGERSALDTLFEAQSKVIWDISEKGSCVIVGRCADRILQEHPGCFTVFIHAPKEFRLQRIIHEYGLSPVNAGKEMSRIDRERVNYCRHYTQLTRGKPGSYNLSIDSSVSGIENAAKMIVDALNKGR
jgi:uncharacterized membrane protein YczE/cytidylate kinase